MLALVRAGSACRRIARNIGGLRRHDQPLKIPRGFLSLFSNKRRDVFHRQQHFTPKPFQRAAAQAELDGATLDWAPGRIVVWVPLKADIGVRDLRTPLLFGRAVGCGKR